MFMAIPAISMVGSVQAFQAANNKSKVNSENEIYCRCNEESKECDTFENSSSEKVLAAKYDLACRVAAYYKKSYENLLEKGSCIA